MNYFLACKLFIISLFIPAEFFLFVGGLRLEIYRIILGASVVVTIAHIFQNKMRYEITDKLVIALTILGSISLLVNHGLGGIEKAGIFSFEVFGSYFLARKGLNTRAKVEQAFTLLGTMVLIVFIPTIIETLTGHKIIHGIARAITGHNVLNDSLYTSSYMRMGLTRATGAFDHPILNGTVAAVAVPISLFLVLKYRKPINFVKFFACIICAMSALSSAPLLVLIVQGSVVGYVKLKQIIKHRMKYVVMALLSVAAVIHVVSNRGIFKLIIHKATFNPHTGTHRLLIIEYLQDDIMRNPFLGAGHKAYWSAPAWMGQSIDNYWMAIAFKFGIPYAVGVFALGMLCLLKIHVSKVPKKRDYLAYAMIATIISLMVMGITVHMFGKVHPILFFVFGIAPTLFYPPRPKLNRPKIVEGLS